MYCGTGCQPGYGRCDPAVAAPPDPLPPRGTGAAGETCGPIVNRVCAPGLCCSGCRFSPPLTRYVSTDGFVAVLTWFV